jgi:hypothetical protein
MKCMPLKIEIPVSDRCSDNPLKVQVDEEGDIFITEGEATIVIDPAAAEMLRTVLKFFTRA